MADDKHGDLAWYASAVFFIAMIGAHLVYGVKAAVKVIGVACITTGIIWMLRRKVPVGIEGKPPSTYLTGISAFLSGLIMTTLGICMLAYSTLAACLLGWAPPGEC